MTSAIERTGEIAPSLALGLLLLIRP